MFMGYLIQQWLDVIEWFCLMVVLFTSIFIFSCKLSSIYFPVQKINNKVRKDIREKKIFHDVA